jgi:hypothetical protein
MNIDINVKNTLLESEQLDDTKNNVCKKKVNIEFSKVMGRTYH